jgi:hypothetical protein
LGLGQDPKRVVAEAIRRKREDAARNLREDRYSQVWCVFDVDTHETLQAAVIEARRNSIRIAVSNPCFEIWLLWHFEDHHAEVSADTLRRRLRRHHCHEKSIPREFSFERYVDAVKRALRRPDETDAYLVPANPGTTVPPLVQLLAGREV